MNLSNNIFNYTGFWSRKLDKIKFNVNHSIWHYKNLKMTIWIIFFNPIIMTLYLSILISLIIVFLPIIIINLF